MKIIKTQVTQLKVSEIERLDLINVYLEDMVAGQGRIIIECYGQSWSSFWGAMGDRNISEFFVSCDEYYLSEKLAPKIRPKIYDIDQIRKDAEKKGIECWRDDPWNDHDFLNQMYGGDMMEWSESLPKKPNFEYNYLCRIINAVKDALNVQLKIQEKQNETKKLPRKKNEKAIQSTGLQS